MEIDHLDEVDRQLVHALTAAPRAPYRVLAEAVGVSDQTIARRYRRLSEAAGLRVHGIVNGPRAGWVDWLVRLQATPGSADGIAATLARRPDTSWVRLFSGGTEIVCGLQARTPEQRNALFLRGLPGSRRVVQITAHSILHVFSAVEWHGIANALSATQLSKLRPDALPGEQPVRPSPVRPSPVRPSPVRPSPVRQSPARQSPARQRPAGDQVALRPDDDLLLAELARDGRAPNSALAAATHWHESTVRRRIDELQQAGLLYFDVDIDDAFFGVSASAMLWLAVDPAHLEAAGRAVAAHPEVPYAAATTGPTNLVISAVFRDTRHLYEYLTTRLTGLPGVRSVETAPIIGTLKRAGSPAMPLSVRD